MTRLLTILLSVVLGAPMTGFALGNSPPREKAPAVKPAAGPQIDINGASAAALMTLDGIGEASARAIIRGRPYGRKDELARRRTVPEATYEKIRDRLIARQR